MPIHASYICDFFPKRIFKSSEQTWSRVKKTSLVQLQALKNLSPHLLPILLATSALLERASSFSHLCLSTIRNFPGFLVLQRTSTILAPDFGDWCTTSTIWSRKSLQFLSFKEYFSDGPEVAHCLIHFMLGVSAVVGKYGLFLIITQEITLILGQQRWFLA